MWGPSEVGEWRRGVESSRISELVFFRVLNKKVESHTHTHMTLTARLRGRQKLRMIRAICDAGLKARWVQVSCSLLGWLSRLMEGLPEIETLGPALINVNAVPALERALGGQVTKKLQGCTVATGAVQTAVLRLMSVPASRISTR